MDSSESSISKAKSYREIGEFWDEHDLTDYWEQTESVEFEVEIESEVRYVALESNVADDISRTARRKGVAPETLVNLWLREKLVEEATTLSAE
ncbi:MAG TPA: CopG family antitoxin [Anaerolineae bacterium]